MAGKITMGVAKNLPEIKDRAIRLIAALTGESPEKLHKMDMDVLVQYLGYLMQCDSKMTEALLVEHDHNTELSEVRLADLWRLVNKGIVKKKEKTLGSIPKEAFEQIKFVMGMLANLTRFRADNNISGVISLGDLNNPNLDMTKKNPKIINKASFSQWHQAQIAGRSVAHHDTFSAKFK